MLTVTNYIDGALAGPVGDAWIENIEPATGRAYSRLPASERADVERAIDAAARALPAWSARPSSSRAGLLLRLAELVERDAEALARAESIDTGKPITLARSMDIPRAAANFRFFAGAVEHWASQSYRTDVPAPAGLDAPVAPAAAINLTLRQPVGVVGLISPWNLPLYLLSWKIAPAIATGNTCVCKPSELTPMTAHRLAELCREAWLPPGVVNIVHGTGAAAGAPLVADPRVKAISFTGSTATGAALSTAAAPRFAKLSLELGGKNPTIVFDDADLEDVALQAARAAFTNQGQVCLCGSRILVSRRLYEPFLAHFTRAVAALRMGDPLAETTQQGALVSAVHLAKVRSYVELARREGAQVWQLPFDPDDLPERCRGGFFHPPVILTDLPMSCRTQQEEIFGPVVCVSPFGDEDEAIDLANATPYGLSASLWTRDVSRALRVSERLHAGTVWVNCWLLRDLRVPFGGVKQSGLGREGGEDALRFFTEPKNICIRYEL